MTLMNKIDKETKLVLANQVIARYRLFLFFTKTNKLSFWNERRTFFGCKKVNYIWF